MTAREVEKKYVQSNQDGERERNTFRRRESEGSKVVTLTPRL